MNKLGKYSYSHCSLRHEHGGTRAPLCMYTPSGVPKWMRVCTRGPHEHNANQASGFSISMAKFALSEWTTKFNNRVNARERSRVSIVYKLYTRSNAVNPHYIGRSDNPLGRIAAHIANRGDCCQHIITHVEFTVIRNDNRRRNRKLKSYQKECRFYHTHTPRCNSIHPAKNAASWRCPNNNCQH